MSANGAQTGGLGAELKRHREERAIELQEISNATRIGIRYLRAIEDNDFDALPGGLFTRSFIKTYARYVGMDESQALQRFLEETDQGKDESRRYDLALEGVRQKARQSLWATTGILLSILIVLGLGGMGGWHFWQRWKVRSSNELQTTSPAPSPAQNATATQPTSLASENATKSSTSPDGTAEGASTVPEPNAGETSTPTPQDQVASGPTSGQAREVVPSAPPLEIRLEATDVCWISVVTDQDQIQRETLRAGETRFFKPEQQVVLSASNMTNLRVIINGKLAKLPAFGRSVREVVISKDNFQQFLRR